MTDSQNKKVTDLSFEEATQELDIIVRKLESGEASLEDSISLYERGVLLKDHCEKKLSAAQNRIDKIKFDEDGTVSTEPLDKTE